MIDLVRHRFIKFLIHNKGVIVCFIGLVVLEIYQLFALYGGAEIVAGGDSYIHLQLGKFGLYPFAWDITVPFGTSTYNIANLLGFQLYSEIFRGIPAGVIQRVMFFILYFLKFVAFAKLTRLFSKKISAFALFPTLIISTYSAFLSLSPVAYFPLMYGIYLPFSIYYFVRIVDSQKVNLVDIAKLVILSVIFSPINSNLALSVTIFIPQVLYTLVNIRKINKITVLNLTIYASLFLLANLWWTLPLLRFFLASASGIFNGGGWFKATTAGYLYQNFRFMGQWGWYGVHFLHAYYPFSTYYDHPFIVLISYAMVIAAFFESIHRETKNLIEKHRTFLIVLAMVALFLASGARYPLGTFYQFLFDYLPGFKIFREPFTKFGELYVLSISTFFYLFLARLGSQLKEVKKAAVFVLIVIGAILISKPSLTGEHVPSFWNGSVRTTRVEVPKYWQELEAYGKQYLKGSRIVVSPNSSYGGAWNWQKGFTSADDVAINFLYDNINVIRYPLPTGSDTDLLLKAFYDALRNGEKYEKYLSLMGADYVLHENDFDWRYSSAEKTPVEINDDIGKILTKVSEFGYFDEEYLKGIPNKEPDPKKRDTLIETLKNQPILVLYKVPDELRVPRIFIAQKVYPISKQGLAKAYPSQVLSDVFGSRDVFVWSEDKNPTIFEQVGAKVEFERINPTKYKIRVLGAPKEFLIQFNERFDPGWDLTASSKVIDKPSHIKTNGYANGWVVRVMQNRENDVYDFALDFTPQKALNLGLVVLILIFTACSLVVALDILKSSTKKQKVEK